MRAAPLVVSFALCILFGCKAGEDTVGSSPKQAVPGGDLAPVSGPVTAPGQSDPRLTPANATANATKTYRSADGGWLKVEGVCSFDKNDVRCWDAGGKSNKELTQKIDQALKIRGSAPWREQDLKANSKNRLVVFAISQPQTKGHGSLIVQAWAFARIGMRVDLKLDKEQSAVRHEAYFVSVDPTADTATIRFQENMPIAKEATIESKLGATASLGGETATMLSADRGGPLGGIPAGPDDIRPKVWTLRLHASHHLPYTVSMSLTPLDAGGNPIDFVDADGNRISAEDARKLLGAYGHKVRELQGNREAIKQLPYPHCWSPLVLSSVEDGVYSIVLATDPAKIGKFRLRGTSQRLIDLTGIPLGPK